MIILPDPGFTLDQPPVTPKAAWWTGINCRFRLGVLETVGLYGALKDPAGAQIVLPATGDPYRTVFTTPSTTTGQILAGSANSVQLIDYDPASVPATGTRWRQTPVTPAGLAPAQDVITTPSAGRVEIPPVWWFSDQDDVVVGGRSNVGADPAYAWDRNRGNDFAPLANSPTGAVGGGILNRILVLLGCTSFTDPDPLRFMTIRWSDRFNFEEWTPSDINISGELQLEGGSRIVGGGVTGFGVVAWTDRRMALLTETFDPLSVFERRYVDGGRGLLANEAWCEVDGQVWWYDEHRTLNVFDGGRPRQIPNPLKYGTIERLDNAQTARAYLVPNPEYGEIILHYPGEGQTEPNRQLVYNYLMEAWYVWGFQRGAWGPRFGVIEPLAVDAGGAVWRHDIDVGLQNAYVAGPPVPPGVPSLVIEQTQAVDAADVEPYSFVAHTNLVTTNSVTRAAQHVTRINMNHMPAPAQGAEDDEISMMVTGYGDAQVTDTPLTQDVQTFRQGVNGHDYRVGGKALQFSVWGVDVKTVFRIANFEVLENEDGQR